MKIKCLIIYLFTVIVAGCSQPDGNEQMVFKALDVAGSNRHELQKVLDYYACDSLRLRAAKFLIGNMPRHYSYVNQDLLKKYNKKVDSVLTVIGYNPDVDRIAVVNSIAEELCLDTLAVVSDVRLVTADFLIDNIESAFEMWQKPFCRDLSFDDFCEKILPYKTDDLQPLDNWRESFVHIGDSVCRHLTWGDMTRNSSVAAADTINRYLQKNFEHEMYGGSGVRYPVLSQSVSLKLGRGSCADFCRVGLRVLRSAGVPAVNDFIPVWGEINSAHTWVSVFDRRGLPIYFSPMTDEVMSRQMINGIFPKVYRKTYAQNPLLIDLNERERDVPGMFRDVFIKDVTADYTKVSDVKLSLTGERDGYVYLACPFAENWMAVAMASISGGEAIFENVGRGCVYMPVRIESGDIRPLGSPFLLDSKGQQTAFNADVDNRVTADLYRKYPVREYVDKAARNNEGGVIECSNSPDFNTSRVIVESFDGRAVGHDVAIDDSIGEYRYWRYRQFSPDKYCALAELKFVTEEGVGFNVIGNEKPDRWVKIFDGDLLTAHIGKECGAGWVGVDFGRPTRVESVRLTPCGDGNTIDTGDRYELLYWSGDEWTSLGEQTATTVRLTYDNIPQNALLLLIDRTKGTEHRVFRLLDSGEQEFI